jgi:hypothetical protein
MAARQGFLLFGIYIYIYIDLNCRHLKSHRFEGKRTM